MTQPKPAMRLIKSIEELSQAEAKALLLEAVEEEFDSVIVLGFRHSAHQFSIKSSKCHERLTLLGALREAEHHMINGGGL